MCTPNTEIIFVLTNNSKQSTIAIEEATASKSFNIYSIWFLCWRINVIIVFGRNKNEARSFFSTLRFVLFAPQSIDDIWLCLHLQKGRTDFVEIKNKYGIWENSLSAEFGIYFRLP